MADQYRDQELMAAVVERIAARDAAKVAVDGEPEMGQQEPAWTLGSLLP